MTVIVIDHGLDRYIVVATIQSMTLSLVAGLSTAALSAIIGVSLVTAICAVICGGVAFCLLKRRSKKKRDQHFEK